MEGTRGVVDIVCPSRSYYGTKMSTHLTPSLTKLRFCIPIFHPSLR